MRAPFGWTLSNTALTLWVGIVTYCLSMILVPA